MNYFNDVNNLIQLDKKYFLNTYKRIPLNIDYGKDVYLFDKNGEKYLDFFSGLAVNALGYAHPKIIKAVNNQISKFGHLSNYFITDIQIEFIEKLLKYSNKDKAFLTNSGTEAIESAIKLIRMKFGSDKKIFSLSDSFHGRTYGALSLTAREKYKLGFEPFLENIGYIKFNDLNDLNIKIDSKTSAVFLEFIQGESGINEVSNEFVKNLKFLKNKFKFLVVADCIQCGIGRTGKPYSFNHYEIIPDIIVTAKAIGGGLPLGAMMVAKELGNIFDIGNHGTTFGGNPISCSAGKVVLEEVFENGLINEVQKNGTYFKNKLEELKNKFPTRIKKVKGKGLMLGVEMFDGCLSIVNIFFKNKILINCTNNNVIRILPPLIINKEHIDLFLLTFEKILKENDNKN